MRITVLTVPECPNAPVVDNRLLRALHGREVHVDRIEVSDAGQAARLGMTGSPTVLIDGVDPFAVPGAPASLSCRLYRGPDGRVEGAPSLADLQRVLADADAADDCDCPPIDAAGRGGRGRLAPVAGGLRAVQQTVLRHFAATGHSPTLEDLQAAAAAHGRTAAEVIADLAAEDFLALDDAGGIRAAYPFSTAPTAHCVRLAGGVEVSAMCAIDALGIPDMLGTDAVITSADPVTGGTITITSTGGHMTWQPPNAMVYVGERACTGPAADVTCGALNFFTSPSTADAWAREHLDSTGRTSPAPGRGTGKGHLRTLADGSESRRRGRPLRYPGNRTGIAEAEGASAPINGRRAGAEALKPADHIVPAGAEAPGGIQRGALRVVRHPAHIRTGPTKYFRSTTLPGTARVPERLGHLLRPGLARVEQLLKAVEHAECGGMPQLVDLRAAPRQEIRDVPAAVADGVIQRRTDRPVGRFDVRASLDQGNGNIDVITARRPVQRALVARIAGIGIGPGSHQQPHDLGPVGKVARPVSHDVQSRPALEHAPERPRNQPGRVAHDALHSIDVPGADRGYQPRC